jgi:hypothetical protein
MVDDFNGQRNFGPTLLPAANPGAPTTLVTTPPKTIQPIVTTSVPTTGGSYPILTTGSGGGAQSPVNTTSGSSFFTLDGDHLVIAGDHRIKKKNAIMVGAGLAGAAILLKTIL